MKLRPDQLERHLGGDLAAIYFISGDEPLQVMEASDRIRAEARKQQYSEREVLDVDAQFDWNLLLDAGNSLSLFAEKRIIELRIPSGKPGKIGSQVLQQYAERPADDAVLIITSGKLEGSAKNTKWFKTLDAQGVVIQCWPVKPEQLPGWISQRLQAKGISTDTQAVQLLADRVEGNLLAAAQEIDKLFLLHGAGRLSVEQVTAAVSDSARYNIYDLIDTVIAGDVIRCSRMMSGLRNEGVEPVLMLWALSREIRTLCKISGGPMSADAAMAQLRVWDTRKPLLRKALSRHPAGRWKLFLKRCARIDKVIKGVEAGRPWDELFMLCTQIAR